MLDIRILKDFLALARLGNFSRAAEHCNVTTSGLSRRIAMLWRRSSAMNGFLLELSRVFASLPAELFSPVAQIPGAGKSSHGKGSRRQA